MFNDSQIFKRVKTTEERDVLAEELELLQSSLFEGEDSFQRYLNYDVRSWVSDIIISETKDKDVGEYLKDILEKFSATETIKLGIAYEPSKSSIQRIHEKLVKILGKNILIDLTVNKAIVGGAVIIYKGKYRDFSMKKIFDEQMKGAGDSILKMIDNVPQV